MPKKQQLTVSDLIKKFDTNNDHIQEDKNNNKKVKYTKKKLNVSDKIKCFEKVISETNVDDKKVNKRGLNKNNDNMIRDKNIKSLDEVNNDKDIQYKSDSELSDDWI